MNKKICFSLILTIASTFFVISQKIEPPNDFEFGPDTDYKKYEKAIVEYIDWLLVSPIDSAQEQRKSISKFINEWAKGVPSELIFPYTSISDPIFKDIKKKYGFDLYMSYYGGMIKFLLEHPDSNDLIEVQIAGIEHLLAFYKLNITRIRDYKCIDVYTNLKTHNGLKAYINKKLSKREVKKFKKFQLKKNNK